MFARSRFPVAFLVIALVLLAARALAQGVPEPKPDPLAQFRADAQALVKEDRLYDAVKLLRTIDPSTLEPGPALELRTLIAQTEGERAKRLDADRASARALEAEKKYREAAAALGPIAKYGSPEEKQSAEAEAKRLVDLAAKGDVAAAKKAEEEKKAQKEGMKKDEKRVHAKVEQWLGKRRSLYCTRCRGAGKVTCEKCGGAGVTPVYIQGGTVGQSVEYVTCSVCGGAKMLPCRPCEGKRFNYLAVEDVLFKVYAPSVRKMIEPECGTGRKYAQLLMERRAAGPNLTRLLEQCYDQVQNACDPIVGRDGPIEVEVDPADLSLATAKYKVKLPVKESEVAEIRFESSRWRKQDEGDWFLEPPPDLATDGKEKKGNAPKTRSNKGS